MINNENVEVNKLTCSGCGSEIRVDDENNYYHIEDTIEVTFCCFTIHQYPITPNK